MLERRTDETERQEITHLFKDESIERLFSGLSVLVAARDIGPVRALLPLTSALPLKSLHFLADGRAADELKTRRKLTEIPLTFTFQAMEMNPDVILTAGEVSPGIANMLTHTYEGNNSPVVWIEDVPGSLRNSRGTPHLVFCFNQSSSEIFREQHPDIPADRIDISGLNPDFLRLASEEPQKLGQQTREKLAIADESLVITFIGSKSTDIPYDPQVLAEVATILEELRQNTSKNVVLIRRDHPGEPNPAAYDEHLKLFNGETISMKAGEGLIRLFSTPEVVCASDLLVGVSSTVFEEAAFRGGLQAKPNTRGSLVIVRQRGETLPVVASGSALAANNLAEFKRQISMALFDPQTRVSIHQSQIRYSEVLDMQNKFDQMIRKIIRKVPKNG